MLHQTHPQAFPAPFTIDNLPYGVVSTVQDARRRCAIAIGEHAIDIDMLYRDGFLANIPGLDETTFADGNWNKFAALPAQVRTIFRDRLRLSILDKTIDHALIPLSNVQHHLPMVAYNYSDFYCSLEHASNCSSVFGLTLKPNWFTIPSVYNGRTSSLVVSSTPVTRPYGIQNDAHDANGFSFKPEPQMDFELEMGFWLSKPLPRGQRLRIEDARDHVFGVTLLNDWSARQIQAFEMPPLGPFHSKGSATSISPWIVPIEALEPVKCERYSKQEPSPPPHLTQLDETASTFDIELSVKVLRDGKLYTLCESNLNELHWTPFQQLTHLASAGEGLTTGDVFGTGTISSARTNEKGEKIGLGCLFERQLPEAKLESVPSDLFNTFLQDHDEVIMNAWCKDKETGKIILGFGESRTKLLPALDE